eukprot:SAG31_NODE_4816_length_2936_cov_1.416990_1_plen_92_part_00
MSESRAREKNAGAASHLTATAVSSVSPNGLNRAVRRGNPPCPRRMNTAVCHPRRIAPIASDDVARSDEQLVTPIHGDTFSISALHLAIKVP